MDQDLTNALNQLRFASTFIHSTTDAQKEVWKKETLSERYYRLNQLLHQQFKGIVQNGPFKGMYIPWDTTWSYNHIGQMILGIYEPTVINFLLNERFKNRDILIDIGAADGYYPIGLSMCGRIKQAIAFEINAKSRKAIASNALTNKVADKVIIKGQANAEELIKLGGLLNRSVILIDIEGCEFSLLDSSLMKVLRNSVLIIEIHHWIQDFEVEFNALIDRSSAYFEAYFLPDIPHEPSYFRQIDHWPDDNRALITSEGRPSKMRFLALTPRSRQ